MADDKKNKDSEEEVLDLLSEEKKPSRRERQRQEASKVQSLDDKKAAALDLGIEDDKPKKEVRSENGELGQGDPSCYFQ
jgi:translation initiation factor IF-2